MRTRRFVSCFGAATVLLVGMVSPLPADAAKGGKSGPPPKEEARFTCRASVARVEPAGLLEGVSPVELFVANPAGAPCVDHSAGLPNQPVVVDLGPTLKVSADLLVSRTDAGKQGFAHAGVANLVIEVLGATISASVLTAEATAGPCPSTALQSESAVLEVVVTEVGKDPVVLEVEADQGHVEAGIEVSGLGTLTLHLNETISEPGKVTQRALWLESDLIGDVIVGEAVADVHGDPCGKSGKPPRDPGRFMTGGGSVAAKAGRVTHGAHLRCGGDGPNNLQVNWPGHRFHLESVTSAVCSDDPSIDPGRPSATFDTIEGTGTGRCNGVSGATVAWKLTDAGEPGGGDRFEVSIDGGPGCGRTAGGFLTGGNHQAHSKG